MNTFASASRTGTKIVLGANQYGKAEVRLVKITRDTDRHEIEDLNVTSQLHGDFLAAHIDGDNRHVVPTDTQKNTVYGFARDGVGSPEAFLLRLGAHFTTEFDWVTGGRWAAEQYFWDRIQDHDHAFSRNKSEVRTAVLEIKDGEASVLAGIKDLTVLKSTASEFRNFPVDRYTTLQETGDRILATDVSSRWRYNSTAVANGGLDFNAVYASVRELLLAGFAAKHSFALQQTMFDMGEAVLEAHPEIEEIRFSLPNKHHFLVDLSPFGQDNPNEVFFAADRPYGLIEAAITREGASAAHPIWENTPGFC
ncbi:urate oxidase [Paeniglutamicibacter sp. ABSL32-1]|uniref:factor-independent urate hydroxylase n=1 Tax=Paeniglutamicibacter quisquiliarum TaxID=2849498 RepID=UPI001C2CCE20|nr:urate oxidase [Paeniglutamicibacter quisquiliarum]MBV1781067.1 urate oxidase [Paeniglutamicibacter quisquiliarum]